MTRSCETCEWHQPAKQACAEGNPWRILPPERWCGRWRLREDLCGGKDSRATVVVATVPTDLERDLTIIAKPAEESSEQAAQDEALRWFLRMLAAAGGKVDASDTTYNPINVFCEDFEPLDTFNLAEQRGFTRVTHDSDFDLSTAYLTDAGRAWLAAPAEARSEQVGLSTEAFAAIGTERVLRRAAEAKVEALTQERDRLKAELASLWSTVDGD